MGSAPEMGEDESEDIPPTLASAAAVAVPPAPAENEVGLAALDGLAGYGFGLSRSLVKIDEDDEFKLPLQRRYTANPDVGIGWGAAVEVVDGFAEGKGKEGRGGGMRAVVGAPMLGTLVGRMNRSAIIGSPPPELVRPIPIALGGDRNNIERIAL